MAPLFLLLVAVLAFVFGYRFYAKLLALGVFGLEDKYSTPPTSRPADRDYIPTNPYFLLGHHAAIVATGATIVGGVVTLVWGWVPAFLWVVTGTAVAAGTFGLGNLWLAARRPGAGIIEIVSETAGPRAAYAVALLALLVLLILNTLCAGLAAQVLADQPAAVLPFWLVAALALGLGMFLHGRREFALIPATAAALVAALGTVWLFSGVPVALNGAVTMEVGGAPLLTLNAATVWVVLLFVYSFYAARAPLWKLSRPRAYLTCLLAAVLLLVIFGGMARALPPLTAPEFHAAENAPGIFPWLFVSLTAGALAGFHLLFAHGISAKQLRRESHARLIGYGGALADGVLALSAVLIAATAFADARSWDAHFRTWDTALDLPRAAALYLDGVTRCAAALGLAPAWARVFGAVVLIGLTTATLEAGVRVLKNLLTELVRSHAPKTNARVVAEPALLHIATWTCLLLALADGRGLAGLGAWQLFGNANLLLAGLGLLLLGLALRAARRAPWLPLALALAVLTPATWAIVAAIAAWSDQDRWLHVAAGALLLGIELVVLVEAGRQLRRAAPAASGMSAPPSA